MMEQIEENQINPPGLEPTSVEAGKKKKSPLAIAILLIAILLALAGGSYGAYTFGKKSIVPQIGSPTSIPTQVSQPTTVLTPDVTAAWLTYTNEKYGFEFKHPENWKINQLVEQVEICPPEYRICFSIFETSQNFESYKKQVEQDIQCNILPTSTFIGAEKDIKAENLFTECERGVFGYIYIYHSPKNLVIFHNYNDFLTKTSGGAILSTFKFLE